MSGPAVPAWDPPWEFTGDLTHVRVLPGRLAASPLFSCPQLEAKKARPGIWPVRDRKAKAEPRPPFADVAIGLVRDVVLEHVERGVAPTDESVLQAAVRAAAPRELAPATGLVVQAGVSGYRGTLQRLRRDGALAVDAVLVRDLVVADPQVGGGVVEWAAWALHWVGRDGAREAHLLVWRGAGTRPRPPATLGVVARAVGEGFRAQPSTSWAARYEPDAFQPPPVTTVRIREVGLLDGSDAVLFEGSAEQARALFDEQVPMALPLLAGDAFLPHGGCASCGIRPECRGLARAPGVLSVAGRAPHLRRLSTSDLWTHAVCPQQAHLTADLGLPREPVPQLEAARRGILAHAWLEAAHARGVPCAEEDLPSADRLGPIAEALGWQSADAEVVAPYLRHHPDQCPLTGEPGEVVRPECPVTVWDTDADVIVTTRPDLVITRPRPEGGIALVVRETKTLDLRRLEADEELGLLHHFPQVALTVCLLAEGVNPLAPDARIDPAGARAELELLGRDGGTVVGFPADDPEVVLTARVALAERVDAWIHDDEHAPRPGRQCERCPVRMWCPVSVLADQGMVAAAEPSGEVGDLPLDVLALIEADAGLSVDDDEFPF